MNLVQLRYFTELAATQHYTRAAERLCITQPSLSHAIAQLEEELGVPLFEKRGRGTALTPFGGQFLGYARQALATLDLGVARMQRLSRGEALALARRTGACLHYDAAKHLTCFSYRDETGAPHTVRFAGLRSWMERLRALEQAGVAALALHAPDPALCLLLHTQFKLG